MLKHSETIINSSVRRQDTTWDYRWDFHKQDDPNTIFLRPDMQNDSGLGNETWYFCGDANELRKYDSSTWDPDHPVFEYEVYDGGDKTEADPEGKKGQGPNGFTDDWDARNPNNPTRYLRPGDSSFMRITNTVENVTIDPVPPEFVSDYGTEYLALESNYEDSILKEDGNYYTKALRDIVIEFKDEVGLDFRQVALIKGDYNPESLDQNQIIYYYDRTLEEPIKPLYFDNIVFRATKTGHYQVKFTLNEKWAKKEIKDNKIVYTEQGNILDELNESNISLIVWDLAGNYSVYKFTREFKTLSIDDLNKLIPVIISFVDIEPNDYFLEDGIEGKIVTQVQDPNEVLWEYENVFDLMEESIGVIDTNTIESNLDHNPLDGLSQFIITHLTESGNVEVEAWVETGFPEIDELIKERTYNTAICGPWVYGDEGRKYHITPYVPKYLHGTEFADFIEFFQLYINTMYKGLENNRHISGLEKIARIGNFNDISRLENTLVYHYANEFGNEFDFDVESLQNVNLVFNGEGFTTRDTKETFDIIKYVLEQLPAYNRFKGTNTGMEMAIKMFGFVCRIINIWVQKEQEVEVNPEFIEEDSLYETNNYFMTSRFNLDLDATNNSFKTFCDNIQLFIDLIKSIKPITKILNLIKYTIVLDKDINLVYTLDEVKSESKPIKYKLTWNLGIDNLEDVYVVKHLCRVNKSTGGVDIFGLNYTPECELEGSTVVPSELFNELGKFFKYTTNGITFRVTKHINENDQDEETTRIFIFEKCNTILNGGSFFLNTKGSNATTAKALVNFLGLDDIISEANAQEPSHRYDATIYTEFTLLPGTNYAICEI